MANRGGIGLGDTRVKIIPTSEIKIYQVKESELEQLEHGSQSDLFLEIGIACISIFASFLTSLLTANMGKATFIVFVCIAVISAIAGLVLVCLWYRCRKSKKSIIEKIRSNEKTSDECERRAGV